MTVFCRLRSAWDVENKKQLLLNPTLKCTKTKSSKQNTVNEMETLHVFKFQSYEIIIMELHRLPHLEPRRMIDHKCVNSVKSIYFCVQSICNGECRTDQSFTMVDKVSLIWTSFLFITVS